MNKINVLDCTLRDGGYCNQWEFGHENIQKIVKNLVEANVEIIECGFLTNKIEYNPEKTKYTDIKQLSSIIPQNRNGRIFVVMINYGEYSIEDIPCYDGNSVDGIRIAYYKKDRDKALEMCEKIKEKGYKVFVQAMLSLSYSDKEFLETINMVNQFEPFAFYIVDSFGAMKKKELLRLFYLAENNLKEKIYIGFHSHNNMQLAYSNAQTLLDININRNLIIDSSVYGMGRGAGNLNTELFLGYLNDAANKNYNISAILIIIDDVLDNFYNKKCWGYSLPNYISAIHNAHPNYASYLNNKKTLTINAMHKIFEIMDEEKKETYDKKYIENLYLQYMNSEETNNSHSEEFKKTLFDKTVLLIAPGKSCKSQEDVLKNLIDNENILSISINFDYLNKCDFIFLSNLRRYRELSESKKNKCIVTSNISADGTYLQVKYSDLLNDEEFVSDNAGLMAIRFLINCGIKKVLLAGFDGYSHDAAENYAYSKMAFITRNTVLDSINAGMNNVLKRYSKEINIIFVTKMQHIKL